MDGWIDWHGGDAPLHGSTLVEIEQRDGGKFSGIVAAFCWAHDIDNCDVLRYRVLPDARYKPELCPHCGKPVTL